MREVQVVWNRRSFSHQGVKQLFEICQQAQFMGYSSRGDAGLSLIIQCVFNNGYGPGDLKNIIEGMTVNHIISQPKTDFEDEWVIQLDFSKNVNDAIDAQLQVYGVSMTAETGMDSQSLMYVVRGPGKSVKSMLNLLRMLKRPNKMSAKSVDAANILSDGVVSSEQVRVAEGAMKYGWYNSPRKITMAELAKKIGLSRSTVAEHLQRVEGALVKLLLESSSTSSLINRGNEFGLEDFWNRIHPDDFSSLKTIINESEAAKEGYTVTMRVRDAHGNYKLIRVTANLDYDEEGILCETNGTFENLAGHKEMESILKMTVDIANSKYEADQSDVDRGSWEWSIMTGEVKWSKALFELYGCTAEGFIPSLDSFVDLLHPEDREMVHNTLGESIVTLSPLDFTHRIVRPSDGEVRVMRCTGGIMTDESGVALRVLGMAQDVSELKEGETNIQNILSGLQSGETGTFTINEKTRVLKLDSTALNLLGF